MVSRTLGIPPRHAARTIRCRRSSICSVPTRQAPAELGCPGPRVPRFVSANDLPPGRDRARGHQHSTWTPSEIRQTGTSGQPGWSSHPCPVHPANCRPTVHVRASFDHDPSVSQTPRILIRKPGRQRRAMSMSVRAKFCVPAMGRSPTPGNICELYHAPISSLADPLIA